MSEGSLLEKISRQNGGLSPEVADQMRAQGLDPAIKRHRELFQKQQEQVFPYGPRPEKPTNTATTKVIKYKDED